MSASASSSSRRARRRRAPVAATADEPMMDINTTPLIDVMLVLLIMLIITIPVQLDAIHMQLPVGAAPPPPQEPPPEPLRIDVGADGTVLWNGEALPDTGALDRRLEALAAQPEPQDIHLHPDRQAPYAVVAHVLASAQRDGLSRLAIVGSEQFAP